MPVGPDKPTRNTNSNPGNEPGEMPGAPEGGKEKAAGIMNKRIVGVGNTGTPGLPGIMIGHGSVLSKGFQNPCHATRASTRTPGNYFKIKQLTPLSRRSKIIGIFSTGVK